MAEGKKKEGKGPSKALAPTEERQAPAIQTQPDDGEEILALARREADNLAFSAFRARIVKHHHLLFAGSVLATDMFLSVVMKTWLGLTLYLPLTVSTILAAFLLRWTRNGILWWHGRGDHVTVVWKTLQVRQVRDFALARVHTLCVLANEVGQAELADGIGKLELALEASLKTRRTLKRRVARAASLLKPYGNGIPVPEKLRDQAIALQTHLLRIEGGIQCILTGFDVLEGKLMLLPYAVQAGESAEEELNRLLAELDEYTRMMRDSNQEVEMSDQTNED